MTNAKRSAGFAERRRVLRSAGFGEVISDVLAAYPRKDVARDDVLDACVCCWTADRILRKKAILVPKEPPVDSRRLRMEIWR